MEKEFKALVVEEQDGTFVRTIKNRHIDDLPPGDLLVKVLYSSLNYKDALSAVGNRGVTRKYPHTPGIDAAGIVVSSESHRFKADDKVIVTSYDLGMDTDGGFGQYIRVPSEWAVKLPEDLSMKEAMMLGTAGLTAGIGIQILSETVTPDDGKIIVSGATGGVGTLSVAVLSRLGYSVTAVTGKKEETDFLHHLGADDIILRQDFTGAEKRPLLKADFAGGIDTVGGVILENIIKSIQPYGIVTCCGNAASPNLELTVFPFILRGITLVGIDSQSYPMILREKVWAKLAQEWKPVQLNGLCSDITLESLSDKIDLMLRGKSKGRIVVDLGADL